MSETALTICYLCFTNAADVKMSCNHQVCRSCLSMWVTVFKQYPVLCPCCLSPLVDKECEENLDESSLAIFKEVRNHTICSEDRNKSQCFNPECSGIFDNGGSHVDSFICSECGQKTCLKCGATHAPEQTCDDWMASNRDVMENRRKMAKENKLQKRCGHGMACPDCGTFIEKLQGCDGLKCPLCSIDICFKTKQRRWGPQGKGDISGGCKCLWDGVTLCHPRCRSCH